jgi:uncharacterized protein YndB with AHSA1/START domain
MCAAGREPDPIQHTPYTGVNGKTIMQHVHGPVHAWACTGLAMLPAHRLVSTWCLRRLSKIKTAELMYDMTCQTF